MRTRLVFLGCATVMLVVVVVAVCVPRREEPLSDEALRIDRRHAAHKLLRDVPGVRGEQPSLFGRQWLYIVHGRQGVSHRYFGHDSLRGAKVQRHHMGRCLVYAGGQQTDGVLKRGD